MWMQEQFIEESERRKIDRELRWLWLFWVANLGVLVVLVFVCGVFGERIRELMKESSDVPIDLLRILFLIVGLASLVVAYLMRRWSLTGKFNLYERQAREDASSSNKPLYLAKYRLAIFIPMCLPTTLGIYGFLLFWLGDSALTLYAFMIVSGAALLYHRPKKEEIMELRSREKTQEQGS